MMRMDKLVRQCDMEVMKMAMLKHEETFRQQVHELHRLYRIQRQLMSDLTMADQLSSVRRRQPRRSSKQPRRALNLQLPADEYIVSTDADAGDNDDDTAAGELDLTLAVGGSSRKCNIAGGIAGCDCSSPFASDCSGSGISSSPSSAEYSSEGGAVTFHAPAAAAPPPCQRAMAFELGMGEAMKQQAAPWLVQCQYLSLRMT